MELKHKIHSKVDKTIKYVFELHDKLKVEVSYIDNLTDKDIICVPSQTMCNMSCTFCHLTDHVGKIKTRDLSPKEIIDMVEHIHEDLELEKNKRRLHISYMGAGEALDNFKGVSNSIQTFFGIYPYVTFGVATILPKNKFKELFSLGELAKSYGISIKVHLSLHQTEDDKRKEIMPNALPIKSSISALSMYQEIYGQDVEIHYTLMKDVNDNFVNMVDLGHIVGDNEISVKFLGFNPKESNSAQPSDEDTIDEFMYQLDNLGIENEYYVSPGHDITASCGEFLINEF